MPTLENLDGTDRPTVSVVMPVYQVVDYVDEAVSSVLNQTYRNFELILIDDGSTDGSEKKCDAWAEIDPRVAVVHQKNAGQSSARNLGISKARGEFILFVDSDDYLYPSLLDAALERLTTTKSDICFFKYVVLQKDGSLEPYKESAAFPEVLSDGSKETLGYLLGQRLHHYPWMRLAKTKLYTEDADFFPLGRKMEDVATTPRLVARADVISFLDEELYVYRIREGSTVTEWSHQLTLDTIAAVDDIRADLESFDYDIRVLALNYKVKMLFYCMMNECKLKDHRADKGAFSQAKREMLQAVKACGWINLSNSNKLKVIFAKLGMTGLAAKAR